MTDPVLTVIHPHLHPRHTGVTGHVEALVPALGKHVRVFTVGRGLSSSLPRLAWSELWKVVRTQGVLWHAHRNNELLFGLALRLFARRLKIVFTRHSPAAPSRYTRWLARHADQVVTLTPAGSRFMGGVPSTVVGHGADLSRYSPPEDRREAASALGLPSGRVIGIVGRVRPNKGHGDFVEAISPLLARFPNWHVVVVGRVAPEHRVFASGLEKRLSGRATFAGERQDIDRWYRAIDVLVHPSWGEGYSMVLLEAMASGCCVVTSSLPYVEGLVEHGRNGFVYPTGDVPALSRMLEELLARPDRADAVGRTAAADARARLGVEVEAGALVDLYRRVIARNGRA